MNLDLIFQNICFSIQYVTIGMINALVLTSRAYFLCLVSDLVSKIECDMSSYWLNFAHMTRHFMDFSF